jgi:hypothetical protein
MTEASQPPDPASRDSLDTGGRVLLSKLPDSVPDGLCLVHNDVWPPAQRLGTRGSRAWLQRPCPNLTGCDCGWAAQLGPHFVARAYWATPTATPTHSATDA